MEERIDQRQLLMQQRPSFPWFDIRLNQEEMDFLNQAISKENKKNISRELVGNIFKSELIEDKDNWFYETVLKKLTEKLFYRDWNNYCRYQLEKTEEPPKFVLETLWVNYQKKHEFNPIHDHRYGGLYSFVIFMKIPTHWKEQHALPISTNSGALIASDFTFIVSDPNSDMWQPINFPLCPEDEGRMLFFPSTLNHQVYPFYECEEERITISGNIVLEDLNILVDVYEEKKNMLKMMENDVEMIKKELEWMEKN